MLWCSLIFHHFPLYSFLFLVNVLIYSFSHLTGSKFSYTGIFLRDLLVTWSKMLLAASHIFVTILLSMVVIQTGISPVNTSLNMEALRF